MFISIDLGSTNTRIASSKDLDDIYKVKKFATSHNLNDQIKLLNNSLLDVSDHGEIKNICLGVAGILDRKLHKVVKSPNNSSLNGVSLESLFEGAYFRADVVSENDALLGALGEAVAGAGKEYASVAYLTLGTGVGGARINNKNIDTSFSFFEPGHQIIVKDGRYNKRCKQDGCLESYVSGTAFEEIYEIKPENCTDLEIWKDYAKFLSIGILNILAMWSPDILVLGGSVSNKFDIFNPFLMEHLKTQTFFSIPSIKKAELGDLSGVMGGFILLRKLRNQET